MDIGSAFTFMFDDEDWIKKIAIGGVALLLAIIIVPIFAVNGYMLETLKNTRDGRPTPLPEWNELGSLIVKGLIVSVIGLVYSIPAIIFFCLMAVVPALFGETNSDMTGALLIVFYCLMCIGIFLTLIPAILFPAGLIRYAQYETIGSAFQFGEIFNFISSNLGDYIIAILLSWVAGFIASFGIILCGIGIYFTNFWGFLVAGNLYGQLARKAAGTV